MSEPKYFHDQGWIFQRSQEGIQPDGTRTATLGFRVCRVAPYLQEDAGEVIAQLMNAGDAAITAAKAGAAA